VGEPTEKQKASFEIDDFDVPLPASKPEPEQPPPSPPPVRVSLDEDLSLDAGFGEGSPVPSSRPASSQNGAPSSGAPKLKLVEAPKEGQSVLRWVFRAPMTQRTMKKLHAVCVLADGQTPLRVVDTAGNILIAEAEGVLVDAASFPVIAGLFGLG
jgi:hypothetical protein